MAKLSIREAVKLYKVSRPTLSKALKNGLVSGEKDGQGQWQIDHSELTRVYRPRSDEVDKGGKDNADKLSTINTPASIELERLKGELAVAEARAEAAEKIAQERADRIEDLRRMLPAPTENAKRRWWPWGR